MTKKYTLTTSEETVTENPEDIIRLMKLAGLSNAQAVAEEEVTEEARDWANTPGGTSEEQLELDPTDFEKKTGDAIAKQKKSIQPTLGDNPLEYSLDENEIYDAMMKEFPEDKVEEITEKQSPAQKAAFAKMLAAKNGKKDDTVEEKEETTEEKVEETTVEENLEKAQEEIDELKEELITEDCSCGHGSDCDCGSDCGCGCNTVNEDEDDGMLRRQDGEYDKDEIRQMQYQQNVADPLNRDIEASEKAITIEVDYDLELDKKKNNPLLKRHYQLMRKFNVFISMPEWQEGPPDSGFGAWTAKVRGSKENLIGWLKAWNFDYDKEELADMGLGESMTQDEDQERITKLINY